MPRGLTTDTAAQALRRVRPATQLATTLRKLASDLLGELRRLDRRIASLTDGLTESVTATNTTLTELPGIGVLTAAKILPGQPIPVAGGVGLILRSGSDRGFLR